MTGIQIYNAVWLCVWLLCLAGAIWGVCAGNPMHWLFVAASLYFSGLLFFDKEDGESLKDLLIRKIKARRARKVAKQ